METLIVPAMLISVAGFILSGSLHLLMLFGLYSPPREFVLIINTCAFLLNYVAILIRKRVCDQSNTKDFGRVMLNACPKWLSGVTGILLIYAFAGLAYVLYRKYSAENGATGDIYGFSGHWMALYALAFTILYCCKKCADEPKDD